MADEPLEIVLVHLREVRAERGKMRSKMQFDDRGKRSGGIHERLGEVHETALLAVGSAAVADRELGQHVERVEDRGRRTVAIEQRP